MKTKLDQKLKEYLRWRGGLSDMDRMNFECLIDLPNAQTLVAQLQPGKYQDMAIFALAMRQTLGERNGQ